MNWVGRRARFFGLVTLHAFFNITAGPAVVLAAIAPLLFMAGVAVGAVAVFATSMVLVSPRFFDSPAEPSADPATERAISTRASDAGGAMPLAGGTQPSTGTPGSGQNAPGRAPPMSLANEQESGADPTQNSITIPDSKHAGPDSLRGSGGGASAGPQSEQMTPDVARRFLDRLLSLFDEKGAPAAASAEMSSRPAARVSQADPSNEVSRGENPGNRSEGERPLNALLRAISAGGTGDRQTVPGEGAGEEQGRSDSGGGAMGRRVGVSQAGAGSQHPATGNPDGNIASDPVLGAPTQRLQMQLRRVAVRPGGTEENDGWTIQLPWRRHRWRPCTKNRGNFRRSR